MAMAELTLDSLGRPAELLLVEDNYGDVLLTREACFNAKMPNNLTVAGAWVGKGELNFPEANGEELHALAPRRIQSGFRYSLSYSVSDLKILEDHARR